VQTTITSKMLGKSMSSARKRQRPTSEASAEKDPLQFQESALKKVISNIDEDMSRKMSDFSFKELRELQPIISLQPANSQQVTSSLQQASPLVRASYL